MPFQKGNTLGCQNQGSVPWNKGRAWPAETRAKIGSALKGRLSPNKGKPTSEEQKAKLRNREVSEETRRRIAAAKIGSRASSETRIKMSASHMGKPGTMLGRRHSEESKGKMSRQRLSNQYSLGYKHSAETRYRVAVAARRNALKHSAQELPDCRCAFHRFPNPSSLEVLLLELLRGFPQVVPQRWFGRFRVDAYLPEPYHLAFEADGEYWHRDKRESDAKRDRILLEKFGLPVVRMSESELRAC